MLLFYAVCLQQTPTSYRPHSLPAGPRAPASLPHHLLIHWPFWWGCLRRSLQETSPYCLGNTIKPWCSHFWHQKHIFNKFYSWDRPRNGMETLYWECRTGLLNVSCGWKKRTKISSKAWTWKSFQNQLTPTKKHDYDASIEVDNKTISVQVGNSN